jgi:hypothetical protein
MEIKAYIQTIATNVLIRRGYGLDFTPEEVLARNVVKLVEELGEVAPLLDLPGDFGARLQAMGQEARSIFDHMDGWDQAGIHAQNPMERNLNTRLLAEETMDLLIVLACMVSALSKVAPHIPLLDRALLKSVHDIRRGVRKPPTAPVLEPKAQAAPRPEIALPEAEEEPAQSIDLNKSIGKTGKRSRGRRAK